MKGKVAAGAAAGVALVTLIGVGVAGAATGKGPGGAMADALAGLVSSGTITQEQADKVEDALDKAREEAWADRQGRADDRRQAVDTVLQDVLGLTRDQVKDRLLAGATVGEVVGDKGADLAAGFQAQIDKHLAEAVSSGRLTQAQADELAARSQQRLEAAFTSGSDLMQAEGLAGLGMLMRQHAAERWGGMGMGHRGRGWHPDSPEAAATASATASSSTSA